MIVRIWRTKVERGRFDEYRRFAEQESLPMFRREPGFRGVLFTRAGDDCAVISLWESAEAIKALERSPTYRETVSRITRAGFLSGPQSLEVLDVHGGDLAGIEAPRHDR